MGSSTSTARDTEVADTGKPTADDGSSISSADTLTPSIAPSVASTATFAPENIPRPRRDRPQRCQDADDEQVLLRKPIIYILSPSKLDVSVTLTLTRELRFSALYPVVPVKKLLPSGEQVQWMVSAREDGTLIHTDTGLESSYLFWEAVTKEDALLSPPHSPTLGHHSPEYFSPLFPNIVDTNSVVLPTSTVIPYLDNTLKSLGLHTEARTSFIIFWLPWLLKHSYVALRFLPQFTYERIAPLDIEPKPDVVTRVFMLFKGIQEDHLQSEWSTAVARASEEVDWREVVGIDLDRAQDSTLFRVLEWGGMEVF